MSNRNDDDNSGIALVFMGLAMIGLGLAIIAAFIAFVLTVIALFAWNKPRRIGKTVIRPEDARGFVYRGIAGAFLLPAFCIFLNVFLGIYINGEYLPHLILGGYVLGSLGLEILMHEEGGDEPQAPTVIDAPSLPQTRQPEILPPPPQEPFRYASWDDEDIQE